MVEVAIGETISMCLFRAARRASVEPLTRFVLSSILADEARHQRLGWSALDELLPTLDAAALSVLEREATAGLGSCEREIALPAMNWLRSGRPFRESYAQLGVLHPEVRVETFYFAVERLVLPRLTRLGFDGQRLWQRRYRG